MASLRTEHKYACSFQAGDLVMVFLSTYTGEENPFFFEVEDLGSCLKNTQVSY